MTKHLCMRLYMLLLGCRPNGRLTEQHDVCFVVAPSLKEAVPQIVAAWPEARGKMHIDAWRHVQQVGNHTISIEEGKSTDAAADQLFFINLGGYQLQEFAERHFMMLVVANDLNDAKKNAKAADFYQENLQAHIDDKFALDIDDIFSVQDVLHQNRLPYRIQIKENTTEAVLDKILNGYFPLKGLDPGW